MTESLEEKLSQYLLLKRGQAATKLVLHCFSDSHVKSVEVCTHVTNHEPPGNVRGRMSSESVSVRNLKFNP